MASELAAGYISLTVKLAKDGMADVTKEVKNAATKGAEAYSTEFSQGVKTNISKTLPQVISTSTTSGGGFREAARKAADEFKQGFNEGVTQAGSGGGSGGIRQAAKNAADQFKQGYQEGLSGMGDGGVGKTSANIIESLDRVRYKVGLVADAISTLNDVKTFSEDSNTWGEQHLSWYKWMNDYTPDKLGQMARERVNAFVSNIGADIASSPGGPVGRFGPGPGAPAAPVPAAPQQFPLSPGRRAGGGSITGPGGIDRIPAWLTAGEHVLTAADVAKMGGQANVYAFRNALHFDSGGGVTPEIQAIQQIAAGFGLSLISGRRAEAGSYHNSGEAGDFSNGSGNTPQELAFAQYMASNYGSSIQELIYSDPNFSQLIGGGRNVTGTPYYSAGVLAQHTNHVHVAIKPGALGNVAALGNSPLPGSGVGAAGGAGGGAPTVPLTQGPGGTWTSPNASWAALIARESGGNPNVIQGIKDANSGGNEAEGLFQITPATWKAHGGTDFAPSPRLATPQEQAIVAARILNGNPSGSDWGAGLPGRENAAGLTAGLTTGGMPSTGGGGLTSTTFQPGSNPYAQLAAAQQQEAAAIKGMLPDFGQLGDIGAGALKENLPPGFFDYSGGKTAASLGALMKSIGILSGNPQVASIMGGIGSGITGSGSGLYQGIMGAIPGPVGTLAPGQIGAPDLVAANSGGGGAGVNIQGDFVDASGKQLANAQKTAAFNSQNQDTTIKRSFVS